MITVVKRPQGYVLSDTQNTATVSSSSGALFTDVAHGLTTGDFVYIYSNLSIYNGYWYVSVASVDTFRIREYATASDQAFVNSGSVTYYNSMLTHGWNCVHLPIIYKLKSDIWPTNGADTARTITTFSNYNGYTYINASGDIKATGTANSLEEVVLSGTSVDGVYKIIQWFSDTNFVIDLAYSAGNVLSSGTVQYYYFNYNARIKIFAGLTSSHYWTAQKPYTEIAELKLVPNSSGIITVNISEIVKKQIEILNNNTIKDTLPNNLDAFTQFYISTAESYDDSNGYTVSEYVSSYTADSFEGYAVNAKLPFRTRSAGALSQYVYAAGLPGKFLTPFTRPSLFTGKYFDLSFINSFGRGLSLRKNAYLNGVFTGTTYDAISDYGTGIYRKSITPVGSEDRIDVAVVLGSQTLPALSTYTNQNIPSTGSTFSPNAPGSAWTLGAAPSVVLGGSNYSKFLLSPNIFFGIDGVSYTVNYNITATGGMNGYFLFLDENYIETNSVTVPHVTATGSGSIAVTPLSNSKYFAFYAGNGGILTTVTVNSLTISAQSIVDITETKIIDVVSDCSFQSLYLTWLNFLSGFDYWNFTARKKYSVDILESKTQDKNIYNNYPQSQGEFADSITQQSIRKSKDIMTVTSQFLSTDQEDSVKLLTSSPLVQDLTSEYSKRTVLVDSATLPVRRDQDKTRKLTLGITYTDEIPTQTP